MHLSRQVFLDGLAIFIHTCFRLSLANEAIEPIELHKNLYWLFYSMLRINIWYMSPHKKFRINGTFNYTILCQKNIRIISFQTLSVFVLSAEAAKSCSKGAIAAFGPGAFHRVFGGGSEILLPRRDCCLWSRRVSSRAVNERRTIKDDRHHLAKGAAAPMRQPHPLFTEVLYHSALTT